jgi:hypothetical protein
MVYGTVKLARGDVILTEAAAMNIIACMQVDSQFCVLVAAYEFVVNKGAGRVWKLCEPTACFTLASGFDTPAYWTFQSDGSLLTLAAV